MLSIHYIFYLTFSFLLFIIGVFGILITKKNILIILLSLELMLLAVNFNFIVFSIYFDDSYGQIFSLLILTVAAAESAIGLAILVTYYRLRGSISAEYLYIIKG